MAIKTRILCAALALAHCFSSFVQPVSARMADDEFLKMVSKDSFAYFWETANPHNGLVPDSSNGTSPCSIASVGFGLTAICVASENKWISKNEAYIRILTTLKTFRDAVQHEHGFYYHFLNMKNGRRVWDSEVSSIDTAILIAGALTAGEYFKHTEIDRIANQLYERVDWPWMLNERKVLCMGWKPDEGFLPYYWDSYSEAMLLYALAIGSPSHPIPQECWNAWVRTKFTYGPYTFISCPTGSLFTYQYSHAWIDFRNKRDRYADYWENSKAATLANRLFCINNAKKYPGLGEEMWGISACIGPNGYKGYGMGPGTILCDGTITPCGVAGSLPFTPEVCIATLRSLYKRHEDSIYGKYGFVDGFNHGDDWSTEEYIGIDQGITVLMIENYRTGFVWKYFMRHPAIQNWVESCMTAEQKD